MYDVNSEVSFTNVRNWIGSVQVRQLFSSFDALVSILIYYFTDVKVHVPQEGVEEGTVLVLIGNKTDLCEDEEQRVVKTKDGARMADVSSYQTNCVLFVVRFSLESSAVACNLHIVTNVLSFSLLFQL